MNDIINSIADKNRDNAKEGDYTNSDGILICGKCHQPKQCIQEYPTGSGKSKKFPIKCKCDIEEEKAFEERMKRNDYRNKMERLYNECMPDRGYWHYNFKHDDNRNPQVSNLCRKYIEHWQEMKDNHYGILFYGHTGGGKSFYACCIATELLNNQIRVLVSRLSDLVKNRNDKETKDICLKNYELIILDDIGVENATQTAYNIVDDIYRHNTPLIVTTNLSPSELKNPETLDKKRIYDRILEMCCITQMINVSINRLDTAKNRQQEALKILNT